MTPVEPLSPEAIRALREREHLSQPVFARYLNVSKNLVSDWERGVKRPGGPAASAADRHREEGDSVNHLNVRPSRKEARGGDPSLIRQKDE
ncbi:helix-turn-helix domain-containing protein [Halochromatium salexigens]|uniref:helix-turn-helix domain-containing protein n=1 Tax=Halochromatium salexigens TaxID=49447 RepID=UPI001F5DA762|nr:helix-turn-helix domain-containing protein [Halochromatium salexigens]